MQQPAQSPQPPQPPQSADLRGATYTDARLRSLHEQRSELKAQLEAITDRRKELTLQSKPTPASERDFQSRLQTLDERSARLEQDIMRADDAIAGEIARGVAVQSARETFAEVAGQPGRLADNVRDTVVSPPFVMALAFILGSVFIWRTAWNRAEKKFGRAAPDQSPRFQQLQQSVDVIALEVERIAEGQRYVTKLLNESLQPALGAGKAEPIQSAMKNAEPARARSEAT